MLSRHVVVVENEPLMRDLIGKTLEASGFRVTTAANAADANRGCTLVRILLPFFNLSRYCRRDATTAV